MNRFRKSLMHTSFENLVMLYLNGLVSKKEVRQQILDRKKWIVDIDRRRDRESDAYEALEEASRNMLRTISAVGSATIPDIQALTEALGVLSDMREN